jgi:hypothetical protein
MKTLKQGASGNHRRKTKEDEGFYLQISRHDSSITIRDENPEAGRRHSHAERWERGTESPKEDEGFYFTDQGVDDRTNDGLE